MQGKTQIMNPRNLALAAVFITAILYGLTFTIAKDVMPAYVKPFGFIALRVFGATVLFWLASLFVRKQRIDRKDFPTIFMAAFFGVALNMLTFFKGLSYTTPIVASVFMVTTPIIVLVFSAIFLKEKLTLRKIIGISIGLAGATILILYGESNSSVGSNVILGNTLVFINATSYALYLIIVKKLVHKYHPLTFVKWLYLFGLVLVLPFGIQEVQEISWQVLPTSVIVKALYVIIFSTFVTYLLNLFALTKLKPTTVSSFIYLQPVFATIFALSLNSDALNPIKIVASLTIFLGVYLVTKK